MSSAEELRKQFEAFNSTQQASKDSAIPQFQSLRGISVPQIPQINRPTGNSTQIPSITPQVPHVPAVTPQIPQIKPLETNSTFQIPSIPKVGTVPNIPKIQAPAPASPVHVPQINSISKSSEEESDSMKNKPRSGSFGGIPTIQPQPFATQRPPTIPQIHSPSIPQISPISNASGIKIPQVASPLTTSASNGSITQIPQIPPAAKNSPISKEQVVAPRIESFDSLSPSKPVIPPFAPQASSAKVSEFVLPKETVENVPPKAEQALPKIENVVPKAAPVTVSNTDESAKMPAATMKELGIEQLNDTPETASSELEVTTTISEAIAKAAENAKIIIPEGTYSESIVVTKPLHIFGKGKVVLKSDGASDAISIKGKGVTISNIEVVQENSQAAGAISILQGSVSFFSCTFTSKFMPTISMKGTTNAKFVRCNLSAGETVILNMYQNSSCTIVQSTIKGTNSNAVVLKGNSKVVFDKSTISDIAKTGLIAVGNSQFVFDNESVISNCGASGIELSSSGTTTCVRNSTITKCKGTGFVSFLTSAPLITNSTITDCETLISASDGAALRLSENKFSNSTGEIQVIAYCHAKIESNNDSFSGTGTAISSTEEASVSLTNATIDGIVGAGAVVFGEKAKLSIASSTINNVSLTGVIAHSGSELNMHETSITKCGGAGIQLAKAGETTIEKCEVSQCEKCGIDCNNVTLTINETKSTHNSQCGFLFNESNVTMAHCTAEENAIVGIESSESQITASLTKVVKNGTNGVSVHAGNATLQSLTFDSNKKSNVSLLKKADVSIENSSFNNSAIGIFVGGNSSAHISQTSFTQLSVGVQCANCKVSTSQCVFKRNKAGIILAESSDVNVEGGSFDGDDLHVEVRSGCTFASNGTQYVNASGVGVHVTGGKATLDKVLMQKSQKSAVASCCEVNISNSKIEQCGICGIYIYGGKGEIKENEISFNGSVGIQVMNGSPTIVDNVISSHTSYGIHINVEASPGVCGNTFTSNSNGNVNRE